MTYDQLLDRLNRIRKFQTLTGRFRFSAIARDGTIVAITRSGTKYPISRELYDCVKNRYNSLNDDQKMVAKNYIYPTWKQCPDRKRSLYLAAIWGKESVRYITQAVRQLIDSVDDKRI